LGDGSTIGRAVSALDRIGWTLVVLLTSVLGFGVGYVLTWALVEGHI
jgi:hypothetical protein